MNKYDFFNFSNNDGSVEAMRHSLTQTYIRKYYNLWMKKFIWKGLDEELASEQENYLMRKFWADGNIAVRRIPNTDLLAFMPYTVFSYNMYDLPEQVSLRNERGVSKNIIPTEPQIVNKDVVIGWCQPNHKPISAVVNDYIDRIVEIELIINVNLKLQSMPYLIGVSETDKKRMQEVVKRILNNEVVVFTDMEDLQKIQSVATQTPYVIDKLRNHLVCLENELLTYLGIDNSGEAGGAPRITIDQVNAGNDLINCYEDAIEESIKDFLNRINKVLGRKITIEPRRKPVDSEHAQINGNRSIEEAKNAEEPTDEQ